MKPVYMVRVNNSFYKTDNIVDAELQAARQAMKQGQSVPISKITFVEESKIISYVEPPTNLNTPSITARVVDADTQESH